VALTQLARPLAPLLNASTLIDIRQVLDRNEAREYRNHHHRGDERGRR
jgi:hypothetical protein